MRRSGAVRKMGTIVCCRLIFIWEGGGDEGKMKMKEKTKMIVLEIILGLYHLNSTVS